MAVRPLNADEAALWRRVTATVRAAAGKSAPKPVAPVAKFVERPVRTDVTTPTAAKPKRAVRVGETLDSGWDRRIDTGRISPDRMIDLHGLTLAGAHTRLDRALDEAVADGTRVILLVTGKAPASGKNRMDLPMRGIIRASVGDWLAGSRHASRIAAVRAAHPRHGGAGALYIVMRRNRGLKATGS